jgi:hypothetical protein
MEQMYISFGIFSKTTMNNNISNEDIKSRNNIPWVKRKERKMLKMETVVIQTTTKN